MVSPIPSLLARTSSAAHALALLPVHPGWKLLLLARTVLVNSQQREPCALSLAPLPSAGLAQRLSILSHL